MFLILTIITLTEEYSEDDRYISFGYAIKEYLDSLAVHKIDVNNASVEELLKIPYIDRFIAEKIVKGRPYSKKSELKNVVGEVVYAKIKKYIAVKKIKIHKFEYIEGTKANLPFEGPFVDSLKIYEKIGINYKNFSMYFVGEKDKEEKNVLDFLSLSIEYRRKSLKIICLDYRLHFGNGLLFSHPYAYSVSEKYLYSTHRGIKPQNMFSEANILRGIALSKCFIFYGDTLNIYGFSALSFIDAKIENGNVISVYYSGLHTTPEEISYKNALREAITGARIEFKNKKHGIGITGYLSKFSHPFSPKDSLYSFYGKELTGISIDGFLFAENFLSVAEFAKSSPGGYAMLYYGKFKKDNFKGGFYAGYREKLYTPHGRYYGLKNRYPVLWGGYSFSHSFEKIKIYFYGSGYRNFMYKNIPFYVKVEIQRKEDTGPVSFYIKRSFYFEEDRYYTYGIKKGVNISKNKKITLKLQDKRDMEGNESWKIEGYVKYSWISFTIIYFNAEDIPLYGYESLYRYGFSYVLQNKGLRTSVGFNLFKSPVRLYGFYSITYAINPPQKAIHNFSLNLAVEI